MYRILNLFPWLFSFLRESQGEAKRVNWPVREKVVKDTIIVIVFALVVAIFLSSFDYLFQFLLDSFII